MKRESGDGSWYKRADGRYCFRVSVGRDEFGLKRRKAFYGFTRAECKEKYEEYMRSDLSNISGKMTVASWAYRYLSIYKKNALEPKTYAQLEGLIRNHIERYEIGNMWLDEVKPVHVTAVLNAESHLSYSHRSKLKKLLSAIFESGMENDLCSKNPCKNITVKDYSKNTMREKYFTVEECKRILEHYEKDNSTMALSIKILAHTGMRRGELLGLMWSDIDIDNGLLKIRRVVHTVEGCKKAIKETAKTKAGIRDVVLMPILKETLSNAEKRSLFVVPDQYGGFYDPGNFSKHFKQAIIKVDGVRPLGTHAFRHALGTHLRRQGVDLDMIKAILGHENIQTTMIYAKTDVEQERKAMSLLPY